MACAGQRKSAGCLFIGDIASDKLRSDASDWSRDIPGLGIQVFQCQDVRRMWDMLQIGFQEVRSRWEMCGVIAEGTGCAAALALACQLPVDGIVLIDPTLPVWDPFGREQAAVRPEMVQARKMARRFAAFARRNLALCVGDMLILSHGCMDSSRALRRAFGNPANCRVSRLYVGGESAKELYTIREFDVKAAISRFLLQQEASKPLAENPEMCIIYG